MSAPCVSVRVTSSLDEAMQRMEEEDVRHLVVVDGVEVVGVLSDRDLLEATGWLAKREREVLEAPSGPVGEFMRAPVTCIYVENELESVLGLLVQARIGCLPVRAGEELVGIVTEMDILRAYVKATRAGQVAAGDDPVIGEVMTSGPTTIEAGDSGEEAAGVMRAKGLRHLPVLEDGKLVGMLSDRDLRKSRGRGQLELSLVSELMSARPETVQVDRPLSTVAALLYDERISAVPVMEGSELRGIASLVDLMIPCVGRLQKLPSRG